MKQAKNRRVRYRAYLFGLLARLPLMPGLLLYKLALLVIIR
jgi:hypothetical protein